MLLAVHGLMMWISYLVPLYIALSVVEQLPNDGFKRNLVAVGCVALAMGLLSFLDLFPYWWIIVLVLQIGLLLKIYDMELGRFFKFLMILWLVNIVLGGVFGVAERGLYGIIAGFVL